VCRRALVNGSAEFHTSSQSSPALIQGMVTAAHCVRGLIVGANAEGLFPPSGAADSAQ
jgi:hypothetical protein